MESPRQALRDAELSLSEDQHSAELFTNVISGKREVQEAPGNESGLVKADHATSFYKCHGAPAATKEVRWPERWPNRHQPQHGHHNHHQHHHPLRSHFGSSHFGTNATLEAETSGGELHVCF